MDILPDQVLLDVFLRLKPDPRMLLGTLRPVCRRWSELALDRSLWRDHRVEEGEDPRLVAAILKLAPRLEYLHIRKTFFDDQERAALAASTECAVRAVRLQVAERSTAHVVQLLTRQVELGRMLRLTIGFLDNPDDQIVLRAVRDAPLQRLDILREYWHCPTTLMNRSNKSGEAGPLNELFTLAHCLRSESAFPVFAPNLQRVELPSVYDVSPFLYETMTLLSECPALQEVVVPAAPELSYLRKCAKLSKLTINFNGRRWCETLDGCNDLTKKLLPFFADLERLKSLHFVTPHLSVKHNGPVTMALRAVNALATSGKARLEVLDISRMSVDLDPWADAYAYDWYCGRAWYQQTMEATLTGLPNLHTLMLPAKMVRLPGVLESIHPSRAPELRMLQLRGGDDPLCFDGTCFFARLRGLLRRNPHLHVTFYNKKTFCPAQGPCDAWPLGKALGVYGHDDVRDCGLHKPYWSWVRLSVT